MIVGVSNLPNAKVLQPANSVIQFREELLKRGEAGGQEAAQALHDSIVTCIHTQHPDFPPDTRIAIRVYGNVHTLGDSCYRAGLVHKPSTLSDFAKGFTGFNELIDFVDVGSGPITTDLKVAGTSRVFFFHLRSLRGSSVHALIKLLQKHSDYICSTITVDKSSLVPLVTTDIPVYLTGTLPTIRR